MTELRILDAQFEVRTKGDNGEMVVDGVAIRYNQPSQDLGGFIEYVKPGAVTRSLQENDIAMLYNHKAGLILGRTSAGTLELRDMPDGLHFTINLPQTSAGRDCYESLKRGDIQGCSFGFMTREDEWNFTDDIAKRVLEDIDLREISFTPFPAYDSTSVNVRAYEEAKEQNEKQKQMLQEIEDTLNSSKTFREGQE